MADLPKPYAKSRTNMLWFSYQHPVTKKWGSKSTGCTVSQESAARKFIAVFVKELSTGGTAVAGPITVEQFFTRWGEKRTNASAADDRARIDKHIKPRIGHLRMDEVKPTTIDDLIVALRDDTTLAPRTIRTIGGLLSQVFKRAAKEGVVASSPLMWERGTLPKNVDADPTWRSEAIYTRDEVELLISDPRVLHDRRVLYALKFLGGGMRHGEAARLAWRNYDAAAEPLGRIALGRTKSGVPREVPVHPTLAKVLALWRESGWAETFGRQPAADDLIVPTRNMTARQPAEAQEAFVADLKLLGLRVEAGEKRKRRGHDLRRTFITLARSDGALDGPLRWVTHGPSASSMAELYSTFSWAMLCTEVAKLRIELREGTAVALSPASTTDSLRRAESAKKRWKNERSKATPTGFEPVLPA
jgi:integrase